MKILNKIRRSASGAASICFLAAGTGFSIAQKRPAYPQTPTFRVQSSLVLVDVISQYPRSGLPIRDFKKEDFRLFDNRHEVRISTFDAGARYDTRPIAVWLVVICNESELPKSLPVVVFLHGDHTGQPHGELNRVPKSIRHLCV